MAKRVNQHFEQYMEIRVADYTRHTWRDGGTLGRLLRQELEDELQQRALIKPSRRCTRERALAVRMRLSRIQRTMTRANSAFILLTCVSRLRLAYGRHYSISALFFLPRLDTQLSF